MKATEVIILEITKTELDTLCFAIHDFTQRMNDRIDDDNYTTTEAHVEQYEQMYMALSELRIAKL